MNASNQNQFYTFTLQAFGLPDFNRISPNEFEEIFTSSILTHKSEIENISQNPKTPAF